MFLAVHGINLSEPPEVLAALMLELAEHHDNHGFAGPLRKLAV